MFIFIKPTSPHEANLRAEKIRNSGEPLFFVPYWNFRNHMCTTKNHAPCDRLKIVKHEPNKFCTWHEPWLIYKTGQIYHPSGKYTLSICSFSEYFCYKIVFAHINPFVPLKDMFGWCIIKFVQKLFPVLNLTIIFMKSFTSIIMQLLSFFNETSFLH